MGGTGCITRDYAMSRARKLRDMAKMMDGHNDYPRHNGDHPESMAQLLRQAAFVIEITAPAPAHRRAPMTEELKPCPFCGSEHVEPAAAKGTQYVRCNECNAFGPDGKDTHNAVWEWNTRPNEALITTEKT